MNCVVLILLALHPEVFRHFTYSKPLVRQSDRLVAGITTEFAPKITTGNGTAHRSTEMQRLVFFTPTSVKVAGAKQV